MKLVIFDLDDTIFDTTNQLDETYNGMPFIFAYPEALDALDELKKNKVTALLVTTGTESIQQEKIDTLDIARYFKEIFITKTPGEKEKIFKDIIKKYKIKDNGDVIIVGDRIDREIAFGNKLGCVTVQIMQGKHSARSSKNKDEIATYKIETLAGLSKIVN